MTALFEHRTRLIVTVGFVVAATIYAAVAEGLVQASAFAGLHRDLAAGTQALRMTNDVKERRAARGLSQGSSPRPSACRVRRSTRSRRDATCRRCRSRSRSPGTSRQPWRRCSMMKMAKTKWFLPAFCVAIGGVVLLVASWIGDDVRRALLPGLAQRLRPRDPACGAKRNHSRFAWRRPGRALSNDRHQARRLLRGRCWCSH